MKQSMSPMQIGIRGAILAMALVVCGCGDDTTSGVSSLLVEDDTNTGLDLGLWTPAGSESATTTPDVVVDDDLDGKTGEGGESATEGGGDASTPDDDATGPAPGAFGYPCVDNQDCLSGFCVESENGKVCTEYCLENCPQGWQCAQVSSSGGDVIYICISSFANLCRPCAENADCNVQGQEGNACLDTEGDGYFCGVACEEAADCPEGYSCDDVELTGGAPSKQCRPAEGVCECSDAFIQSESSTECYKSNEFGTCYGERYCGPDGLTECTAPPGCTNYWLDQDNDGYGLGMPECLCEDPGVKYVEQGGDCNDSSEDIGPLATEVCNGIDDNCDNQIDELGSVGCDVYYADEDGDGYGDPNVPLCSCEKGENMVENDDDCDDTNLEINPEGIEACNGFDDDCNDLIDEENAVGCLVHFFDQDLDEFGLSDQFKCLCEAEEPYTTLAAGDCNDTVPEIKPFATELCDGIDNDCDDEIDEGSPEELCGSVDNGLAECVEGICAVTGCDPGYYDIDFSPINGCECVANGVEVSGGTCQEAADLGTVGDGGATVERQGNAVYEDESDWYTFLGQDGPDNGCDTYHVRVRFLWNPNEAYTFDIHRGSCAAGDQECSQGLDYSFFTDFMDGDKGECGCTTDPFFTTPTIHECTDNSAQYYIRVYRKPEVPPDCQGYALEITNGVY